MVLGAAALTAAASLPELGDVPDASRYVKIFTVAWSVVFAIILLGLALRVLNIVRVGLTGVRTTGVVRSTRVRSRSSYSSATGWSTTRSHHAVVDYLAGGQSRTGEVECRRRTQVGDQLPVIYLRLRTGKVYARSYAGVGNLVVTILGIAFAVVVGVVGLLIASSVGSG